ncbi:unnamed protein product [Rotaria sp. Silwood1]|nr:unnamed protein product [Rotaria sp. Silwood1]
MAFDNESGVISALAHNTAEITQQPIDSDPADQKCTEYLPYPDDNFDETVDDRFQRGEKFTFEHIHAHTREAFVPNVPVHVKSIVAERTDECSAAFLELFHRTDGCGLSIVEHSYSHLSILLSKFFGSNQDENNEYPCIPTRNDLTAFTNDSIVEELCPILVDYLNKVLRHPKFRAHPATCEFFHVSYLSFVHDVSTSRKEGYLQEESINYYFDYHAFLRASCFCDLCKCYDTSKWFIIKDSYIVDIRPDIHEKCFPMLVDCDFQISSDIQNIGYDDDIKIINSQRILLIKCRTAHNCNEWAKHLSNLTQQAKDFASETRNRSDSYAPIRENQLAY